MRGAVAATALALLGGCGSSTEAGDDPACADPGNGEPVPDAVQIGTQENAVFRAYQEGEAADLVLGLQGGFMLLPAFRIDAAALGSDGRCARLDVAATVDSEPAPSLNLTLPSHDPGSQWIVADVPLFLSSSLSDLEGKYCRISALVRDGGHSSSTEVGVVLTWNQ